MRPEPPPRRAVTLCSRMYVMSAFKYPGPREERQSWRSFVPGRDAGARAHDDGDACAAAAAAPLVRGRSCCQTLLCSSCGNRLGLHSPGRSGSDVRRVNRFLFWFIPSSRYFSSNTLQLFNKWKVFIHVQKVLEIIRINQSISSVLDCFIAFHFVYSLCCVCRGKSNILQKYIKAVYREYTDSTYSAPKPRSAWAGGSPLFNPHTKTLLYSTGVYVASWL